MHGKIFAHANPAGLRVHVDPEASLFASIHRPGGRF